MIKRTTEIIAIILLVLPVSLFAQEKKYHISGHLTGANGQKVYLVNAANSEVKDSVELKDATFSFSGKVKEPVVYAVFLENHDNPLLTVINGGDSLLISTSADVFPLAEVSGNEQAVFMQQYQHDFQPLITKAQQLNAGARQIQPNDTAAIVRFRRDFNNFDQEVTRAGVAYIRYHPKAIASLFVLMNELRSRLSPVQLEQLYTTLDNSVQQTQYGKATHTYIEYIKTTSIGGVASDFTLEDTDGKQVSLSSFRGKYVLIDFWASWCGPCRRENPNVVAAYKQFRDKNFTILGVSLDEDRNSWLSAIQRDGLTWTQVSDLQGFGNKAAQLYHIRSIPANFLLDPQGRIIAKDLRGEALEKKLQEVLH